MATPGIPNWQAALLGRLGYKNTPQNDLFLTDWSRAEGGGATNNPFNTTQPGYHSTGRYNSVGVQNYADPNSGLDATAATLKNGRYGNILAALQSGNNARAAAQALANSPWGTGSLVLKMLGGGGGAPAPPSNPKHAAAALAAQAPAPQGSGQRNALLSYLSSSLGNYASTGQVGGDLSGLLASMQAQQQPDALAPLPNRSQGRTAAPVAAGGVPGIGASHGIVQIPGTSFQANSAIIPDVQAITHRFGVSVNSAYRSPAHNAEVGGAPHSDHLSGNAIDFTGSQAQMKALYNWAQGRFPYVEPWGQAGGNHVHISFIR